MRGNSGSTLAVLRYDPAGRRSGLGFAGTSTGYAYDGVSRLRTLNHGLADTAFDLGLAFTWNPASQVDDRTGSNDAYASNNAYDVNRSYSANGLNQYLTAARFDRDPLPWSARPRIEEGPRCADRVFTPRS